ncbi:hypothetical protein EVAR_5822_1 [Eumeta japonica]|uniref:Uncharacterized protein n=1 Tax=Eumeta variegata TaxID=151549 RepID=A0A4C1T4G4_EUMVA|nr:hypothetical protein EVAR_5822_1 [Eumeta japonica]
MANEWLGLAERSGSIDFAYRYAAARTGGIRVSNVRVDSVSQLRVTQLRIIFCNYKVTLAVGIWTVIKFREKGHVVIHVGALALRACVRAYARVEINVRLRYKWIPKSYQHFFLNNFINCRKLHENRLIPSRDLTLPTLVRYGMRTTESPRHKGDEKTGSLELDSWNPVRGELSLRQTRHVPRGARAEL